MLSLPSIGTRGGQDQFKWEDVKEDKHRENYLGNSLLAPVGRWQKGRDLTWYAKAGGDSKDETSVQDKKRAEIQSIKDAEAEAMAEALYVNPLPPGQFLFLYIVVRCVH